MRPDRLPAALAAIEGVDEGESAFRDGPALWVNGKEIAHFDGPDVVDIRLTAAVIRSRRAELREHPSVTLRRSSSADWLEVRINEPGRRGPGARVGHRGRTCAPGSDRDRSRAPGDRSTAARGCDASIDRAGPGITRLWSYPQSMCRNITTLRGLEPPATSEEIEAAARQYVRKVSGVQSSVPARPKSRSNERSEKVRRRPHSSCEELPPRRQPPPTFLRCGAWHHDVDEPPTCSDPTGQLVSLVGDGHAGVPAPTAKSASTCRSTLRHRLPHSCRCCEASRSSCRSTRASIGSGLQVADVDRCIRGRSRRRDRVRRPVGPRRRGDLLPQYDRGDEPARLPHAASSPDDVVATTVVEHHANLLPWSRLAECRLRRVRARRHVRARGGDRSAGPAHRSRGLLAVTAASNITGWMPPIEQIVAAAHDRGDPRVGRRRSAGAAPAAAGGRGLRRLERAQDVRPIRCRDPRSARVRSSPRAILSSPEEELWTSSTWTR